MYKISILIISISLFLSQMSCTKTKDTALSAQTLMATKRSPLIVFPNVPEAFFIIEQLQPKKIVLYNNSIIGDNVIALTRNEKDLVETAPDTAFAYYRWDDSLILSHSNNAECLYLSDSLLISETITTGSGEVIKNEYAYNSLGYSLGWKDDILTYTGDKVTSSIKYGDLTYDANNRIISSTKGWSFAYNDSGFVKEKIFTAKDPIGITSQTTTILYTYNIENRLASVTMFNGARTLIENYTYNSNGDITLFESIEKDSANIELFKKRVETSYSYDASNGNWSKKQENTYINGTPSYSFLTTSTYYLR